VTGIVVSVGAVSAGTDGGRISVPTAVWSAGGVLISLLAAAVVVLVAGNRDRAGVEALLRASEATRRASLDAIEQGVVLSTITGHVVMINDAGRRILGYTEEELTERFATGRWETYREDGSVLPPCERPLGHTMATGEAVRDTIVGWRTKAGRFVILRVATQPVCDEHGVLTGVVTAFTDVTAERHAQAVERAAVDALAAAEDELRRSFDESLTGMVLIGLDGCIRRANAAYAEIVGQDLDALVGTDSIDVLPVEDDEEVIARSVETGALPNLETERRVVRPDGTVAWVRAHTSAVRDRSGEITHFVSQVHDVTDARAAAEQLRAVQARYTALVERSTDIICLIDADERLVYASPAAERTLGYEPGSREGQPFTALVHPDDVERVTEAFADLVQRPGATRSVAARLAVSDGRWRHMEVVATNRLDDDDVRGVVANVRDITERAEEAARLSWQAFHDTLTGLANRALLQDRLSHALARARRGRELTALLYLDLDHFKAVNDSFGHEAGDRLLAEVAARMTQAVRAGDTVARIGGDEFVILAETLTVPAEAQVIAQRVLEALAEPFHLGGRDVTITASVGIAFDEVHNPELLLRDADLALYQAKRAGRHRYIVFEHAADALPTERPARSDAVARD
jgi:diguanylate cyclase (GGDEF)-like protein/PAS domain S-box-containing protein